MVEPEGARCRVQGKTSEFHWFKIFPEVVIPKYPFAAIK